MRLGPYEVQALLGAGGMGEVYRARDSRLDRTVAIKVLPQSLSTDPDRRARFEREARAISALNHPHICTLHDVGEENGIDYLVMEYLDGESLADRLVRGALPLDQALRYGAETAEALDKAHRRGIVHRDLKPGNVMLTKSGVKLLDFGLARLRNDDASEPSALSSLPTQGKPLTEEGAILGTLQYMSPEQLEGSELDSRADVWALGLVLYEMTTGQKAFRGKSRASLIAAILEHEPQPLEELRPLTPKAFDRLVRKCLAKEPDERWQSASDLASELRWLMEAGSLPATPEQNKSRMKAALLTSALVGLSLAAGAALWNASKATTPHVTRATLTGDGTAVAMNGNDRDLAITPDGSKVVYIGNDGKVLVRALDTLEPVAVTTEPGARGPFLSPDGQWVGFFENGTTLKKVSIAGGAAIKVGEIDGTGPRGAIWMPDGSAIVANNTRATGLLRFRAGGGSPVVLTRADPALGEVDHFWPERLPSGDAVLFTIAMRTGGLDEAEVAVLDLRTGKQRVLLHGASDARYLTSGHLVFAAAGALQAVAFDPDRLEILGAPVPVLPRLIVTGQGGADFDVSEEGTLAYVDASGAGAAPSRTLVWVDRTGGEEPIPVPPRAYVFPRLSPDGTQVAVYSADQENDIWIWDLKRSTLTRLTAEFGIDSSPLWTADGRRVIFHSDRDGAFRMWWQKADGTDVAEPLSEGASLQFGTGLSPDGRSLLITEMRAGGTTGRDIMRAVSPTTEESSPSRLEIEPLIQTQFNEANAVVSPDGRWLAYDSDRSGRFEIYVRPYPKVTEGQWSVSTVGGMRPLWSPRGDELFYMDLDGALMRVPVAAKTTWNAGTPTKLLEPRYFTAFAGYYNRPYDISPDGRRFLMIKDTGAGANEVAPRVVVVTNWFEELKRLVPVK